MPRNQPKDDIVITWPDVIGKVWIWVHCPKCGRGTKHDLSDIADRVRIEVAP